MKLNRLKFQNNPLPVGALKKDRIFSDFVYLGIIQSFNLIIPLLLVPYLVKIYGIAQYGWIAICQSFTNYLIIITDYGFNLTAVRDVSAFRENKERLSSIFTSVTFIKIFLFVPFVLLLFLGRFILPQFQTAIDLLLVSCAGILFQILFPVWLFQGLEKIKLGTAILLGGRLIHAFLFFVFATTSSHLPFYFYLQALSYCIAIIIGLVIITKIYRIEFGNLDKAAIKYHFRDGWQVYVSNISINIYGGSSTIILGILKGTKVAAIFGIADQVLALLRQPLSILIRVVYPKICLMVAQGSATVRRLLKDSITPVAGIYVILCSLVFIFAKDIGYYFSKESFTEVALLVRIMCFLPIPILLLNTSPYVVFLAQRMDSVNSRVIITGAVIGLLTNLILSYFFSAMGSAFSIIITELFVGISLTLILKNKFPEKSLY